ncbi:MAG: tetratricopeptide repeat protein, partial [Candidatus Acidiferrales bacterium]
VQDTGSQSVAQQRVPSSGSVSAAASSDAVKVAEVHVADPKKLWKTLILAAVAVVAALVAGGLYFRSGHATSLTEKDTLVLADFTNNTGDPVFDDTLKQALAVDLGQSPFLNILSEDKVRQMLQQMTHSPNERLTQNLAREVCQRAGSKAYLTGSIAALGTQYVIGLEALNCASGDVLAREQATAAGKEQVLPALGQAAARLRNEVGESLSSVQKFDTPLDQATTSSLEALKEYSEGFKIHQEKGDTPAIPLYKRAIELDPNFTLAYANLGIAYANLGEHGLARENISKAYELRDRVSEREKFRVTAYYYDEVTGEIEKGIQAYEAWSRAYPRDEVSHLDVAADFDALGQFDKAISETLEAIRLNPEDGIAYSDAVSTYSDLNRFDEAKAAYQQAISRGVDSAETHVFRYYVAFYENDTPEMARQFNWGTGRPGDEDPLLNVAADTEAYYGRYSKARELTRRAVESALRADEKETAALYQGEAAIREAEVGNFGQARQGAAAALAMSSTDELRIVVVMALARAGDGAQAAEIARDVAKNRPLDTTINNFWLPSFRALVDFNRNRAANSIEILRPAIPYELGSASPGFGFMYPAYLRGEGYLALGEGNEAAAEFQKFVDHRGINQNFVLGALAHLGLARAYSLRGDGAKARTAYQDFLALWKDADPDIPILIAAKAEYAKVK